MKELSPFLPLDFDFLDREGTHLMGSLCTGRLFEQKGACSLHWGSGNCSGEEAGLWILGQTLGSWARGAFKTNRIFREATLASEWSQEEKALKGVLK